MSPSVIIVKTFMPGFPRPRGDEPAAIDGYTPYVKFSPPTRG